MTAMVLVPFLTSVIPLLGLINPLWSSVFGLPLRVMILLQPHPVYGPHPWYEIGLVLFWPLVLTVFLAISANWILARREPLRRILLICWLISLVVLVPVQGIGPFVEWPLYALD